MEKEKLEKVAKALYKTFENKGSGASLLHVDGNGEVRVVTDTTSDLNILIKDENETFEPVITKLKELGYSVDLDTQYGLGKIPCLIRVDIQNKTIKRPFLASVNHYKYLVNDEAVLLKDTVDNFDEIFISKNESLIETLSSWYKNKSKRKDDNA